MKPLTAVFIVFMADFVVIGWMLFFFWPEAFIYTTVVVCGTAYIVAPKQG